ncbi:DUF6923 family protein [Myxococcus landrumensis]|uniref:DUF6923 domain-containing protein n=1 Tax=Myxococcus landrumensis TaxID=2813577 RepID=A0ABX7N0Z1_9BACT|nr:hypothetical protein [Myxococcus landrumus]QSQ12374.1 hypothetical protein JY572_28995 [Myxococcus landrumus]
MKTQWKKVLLTGALAGACVANAHDLEADKRVNGETSATVSTYPATLVFSYTVTNVHPTLPSTLLTVSDPRFASRGFSFTPAPPVDIPVGDSLTYQFTYTLDSFEDCLALAGEDDDPSTPGETPGFTNTFRVTFQEGASEARARVVCEQPPLTCDDTLYISTGVPTSLNVFDPVAGTLTPLFTASIQYNAIGFNQVDGYIYGLTELTTPNRLLRMGSDGVPADLGAVAGLPTSRYNAGTFLTDGSYLVHNGATDEYARIDVVARTSLASGIVDSPATLFMSDMAVNPLDGRVYAYNHDTDRLTVFDPVTTTHTDFGPTAPVNASGSVSTGFLAGSAFFDQEGRFYLYGTDINAPPGGPQNTLYQVNLDTSGFTRIVGGPSVNVVDGASCALGEAGITQVSGFFKVHLDVARDCLAGGTIDLGVVGGVRTLKDMMTVFWASPTLGPGGFVLAPASSLNMRLATEVLTATCNERLFGPTPRGAAVLKVGHEALATSMADADRRDILTELTAFNASGATRALPLQFDLTKGPATPLRAMRLGQR